MTTQVQSPARHPNFRKPPIMRGDANPLRRSPWLAARGQRSGRAKLTDDAVRDIRARWQRGETCAQLAREYSVNWSTVRAVLRRRTWRHVD
jgi:hypothetical protein